MSSPQFELSLPGLRIAPSLLAADFARLEQQVTLVECAGASVLHLDIMDGHFVPNISFGVPVIASLRGHTKMLFDAHLMITEPVKYAEAFVRAGCDHITFHIEVAKDPKAVVDHIHRLGVSAGVALNPSTPASSIEGILDQVELVLVMSVWPGFGGQAFIADVLPKVSELRSRLAGHQRLEVDGGIDARTISQAARAGADTFVAGTAVFGKPEPKAALGELLQIADGAALKSGALP